MMNRFSAALLLIALIAFVFIGNQPGVQGIPQGQDPSCNCKKHYAPVCGTDGKTYSNECVLNVETKGICGNTKSSITKAYDGACKEASQ